MADVSGSFPFVEPKTTHTVGALIMFADWRKRVRHFQFGNKGTELSTQ